MGPVARALIAWHESHGRHGLPWQHDRTPYRVWISEIMLQQTQVSTVVGYYQLFMQRFPDVATLAAAPLDEVLHLWSGLGYYSRARNVQRAAQCIVRDFDGQLPDEREQLAQLPGIGRSTAAALLALASGRREAILDGNVKRVMARYFGIEGGPSQSATVRELWARAEHCTPSTQVAVYTQAIMDFGATLCMRRKPLCHQCPLRAGCVAYREGRVEQLPTSRTPPARRTRSVIMLLAARTDCAVLLCRRPAQGIWGGLWTPPEFDSLEAAALFCGKALGRAELEPTPLPLVRHAFTHFDLHITPVRARCDGLGIVMEGAEMLWYNAREPARIGLPTPIRVLLTNSGYPAS